MASASGIDTHLLHWMLWEGHRGRGDLIECTQADLGNLLGVTRPRAGQVLAKMVDEGRLVQMTGRSRYRIVNPSGFEPAS